MPVSGTLDTMPLTDVLQWISSSKRTGTLNVSVDHPLGFQMVWPDSLDLGPFEILDAGTAPPTAGNDLIRLS